MKKIYLLLIFTLLFVFSAMAQNGYIVGTLIDDETQEPILGASVRVLQQTDSTFVTGQATRFDGTFSIAVENGSYIVHVTFIGYEDVFRDVQINSAIRRAELGTIAMTTDAFLLDEAVITAMVPEIIMRGDTIEFNADAFRTPEGAVLEELLRQLPGVEVNEQGQITVHGRRVSRIMVDDEEFFSTDPTVASQNLPANMVQRVQVAERRSDRARMTGFDDGEEETIINLVTRPGMREALIGEVRAGYGQDFYGEDRYGGRAMINYMRNSNRYTLFSGLNNTNNIGFTGGMGARLPGGGGGGGGFGGANQGVSTLGNLGGDFVQVFSDQFRIGGNIFYRHNDTDISSRAETQRLRATGDIFESSADTIRRVGNNYNMNLRMEWQPNEMTEIIFRPTASFNNSWSEEWGDFASRRDGFAGDTINHGHSQRVSTGSGQNVGGSLNISRRLGREDRVLNVQLDGNTGESRNESFIESSTIFPDNPAQNLIRDQRINDDRNNHSWRASISYVEPLGNNNFLQIAYTYRRNFSESDRDTRSRDANNEFTIFERDFSLRNKNHFVTQEMEVNFRSERGILRYRIGASVRPWSQHNTAHRGDDLERDITRSGINFAPVAQLNLRWNRSHTLEVRYNGITVQPTIDQLSPVVDISNPLNTVTGNPDLTPSFTHEITTRYQLANPERARSLSITGSFRYFTNAIVNATEIDDEGRRITTFRNVGSGNWNTNANVTINSPLRDGSRFSLSSTSRVNYSHMNGFINGDPNLSQRTGLTQVMGLNYRGQTFDFSLRGNVSTDWVANSIGNQLSQQFHNYGGTLNARVFLPWRLTIASDINYAASGGDLPANFQLNEWIWNASVQKTLFRQNNGTLTFNVFDILQQRRTIQRNVTANFIQDTQTNTITSFFMVSFIYRFNIFRGGATRENMMQQRGGQRVIIQQQGGGHGHGGGERVIIREGGGGAF